MITLSQAIQIQKREAPQSTTLLREQEDAYLFYEPDVDDSILVVMKKDGKPLSYIEYKTKESN